MRLRVVLLGAALLVCGCGRTYVGIVAVRHPLQVGTVDANVVELGRVPARDRAALVEVTADRICAEVELHARGVRDGRAIVENYDVGLVADDDTVEQRDPTIVHGTPHTGYAGTVFTAYSPRTGYVYHPASLCFPNGGFVRTSTRRLRLELRPRGRGQSLVFHWELLPAAQMPDPAAAPEPGRVPGRSPEVFAAQAPPPIVVVR